MSFIRDEDSPTSVGLALLILALLVLAILYLDARIGPYLHALLDRD